MGLFVVDYGFCAGSHHFSGASSLRSAASQARVPFHLLAPIASDLAARGDFPARYVLSHRLYDRRLAERRSVRTFWAQFRTRRAAVRNDLHRHLDGQIVAGDTVLLATPMAAEFAGFADWHASLAASRRPAVAAHFLLPLGYDLAPDLPWQEGFALVALREAFDRLRASAGGRALYLAHPRALAARLAALEPRVAVCPSPFTLPPRAESAAAPLTVAVLGQAKLAKGIDLAFAAFDRLQAAGAPLRWIFHTAPLELSRERRESLAAPNVVHTRDVLDRYGELLQSASIVVLPYDPGAYAHDQGSGIFVEAQAMGIPVVCSEAKVFADELAALDCGGLVFRPHTAEALAAKLVEVAADYARYRAIFTARAAAAREDAAPGRLLERLLAASRGEAGDRPAPGGSAPRGDGQRASFLSLIRLRLRSLAPRPQL